MAKMTTKMLIMVGLLTVSCVSFADEARTLEISLKDGYVLIDKPNYKYKCNLGAYGVPSIAIAPWLFPNKIDLTIPGPYDKTACAPYYFTGFLSFHIKHFDAKSKQFKTEYCALPLGQRLLVDVVAEPEWNLLDAEDVDTEVSTVTCTGGAVVSSNECHPTTFFVSKSSVGCGE